MPSLADTNDDNDDAAVEQQLQPPKSPEKALSPPVLRRSERIRKPSRLIRDLQSRKGVTLMRAGSPKVTMGLKMPGSIDEVDEGAGGVWVVIDSAPALAKDFEGLKHTFMAETSDAG